jgi:hypothetical protein
MSERPWEDIEPEFPEELPEPWKAEDAEDFEVPEDWPEDLAGPEYWFYKKREDEE